MIKGIHHINMKCGTQEQFKKAVSFYCDILGMKVELEWAEGVMIDTGAGRLEILNSGDGTTDIGALRHYALDADNVDELVEKVRAAGYKIFIEPNDITIESTPPCRARMAFCIGPLGELVEFFDVKE
ncbi:MAG: VOC family protein [Clostridia bacterium]|nr:VOC family protein [Clostridia bacterium]MBQ1376095.1 VOC family protein [Clostridia bacterium]MBQ1434465.1 VOC family protein [Clostridia bacterium]MBQ4250089.1 VOC family protein [Clostridia bacterium]